MDGARCAKRDFICLNKYNAGQLLIKQWKDAARLMLRLQTFANGAAMLTEDGTA